MNENVSQKAKTPIKQTFYKLTNSANFNIDRQNNIDNWRFEPIYDQISEISFIKKYTNIFGNAKYKYFASIKTMCQEIEQLFNEKFLALDPNDPTFEARKYSINIERAENLDAGIREETWKKKNQKCKLFDIDQKVKNSLKSKMTKVLIDFNYLHFVSIQ